MMKLIKIELYKLKRSLWLIFGFIAIIAMVSIFYFIQLSYQKDYYHQQELNFQKEAHTIETLLELYKYDEDSLNQSQLVFLKEYLVLLSNYKITIDTKDKLDLLLIINEKKQIGYTLDLNIFQDSVVQTKENITLYQEVIKLKLDPIIIDKNVMFLPLWTTFHQNGYHFILIVFMIFICQNIFLEKEDYHSLRLQYTQPYKRSQIFSAKIILCVIISFLTYFLALITLFILSGEGFNLLYQNYPYLFDKQVVSSNLIQLFTLLVLSNLLLFTSIVVTCGLIAYVTYNKSTGSLIALILGFTLCLINNNLILSNTNHIIIYTISITIILINILLSMYVIKRTELP